VENLEKVTWVGWFIPRRAEDYPCIVCRENIAVYSAKFQRGDVSLNCIKFCQSCMDKGEEFILDTLFRGKGGGNAAPR